APVAVWCRRPDAPAGGARRAARPGGDVDDRGRIVPILGDSGRSAVVL
ncbi:MAG: hypothetical protein AVDCRST_MAG49-277, partial [uncultured Thermomicrobiales bacterium]